MFSTPFSPRRLRKPLARLTLAALMASTFTAPAALAQGLVTLNFSNAEIESVARTISAITGRNVVLDSRAKGTISIQSERPVTAAQAVNQFGAALRLQGFALVESGGIYKVVPEADAKLQARVVPRSSTAMGNQVVTRVFKLRYENANNLVPALRPLISPNNTINASNAQTLVVTDYADNMQRIERMIAGMDQPVGSDVEVIPLRYGIATDMAPLVQKLLDGSSTAAAAAPGGAGGGFGRTTVLAEARSNALIVRAPTNAQATQARSLILRLDQPAMSNHSVNGEAGNIWVVHLKNADATRMATTLRAAMAANEVNSGSGTPGMSVSVGNNTQAGGAPQVQVTATSALQGSGSPSTGGPIQADPSTNSLIITASEPEYRQLRAVIEKLDTRRAQIYVESLIVEVSANKAAELGVQWQSPLSSGGRVGLLGTNFGKAGNILGMSAELANNTLPSAKAGINLGALATFRGTPILDFVANFLQTTGDANVLSTPNLITLDNEEARIMIGKNVPFVTGQYTNNNANSVNPFQTIERKDVGLTLRVKPQISENGAVRMQIYQEVSNVDPASYTSATGLITNKRSIESNVVVDDSQIIVLGGLLSDEYANGQEKVPLLGDIPVVGSLFKNENRSRQKMNLMVFLRPVIVRDARDSESLSLDRYDMMRVSQLNTQPASGVVKPYDAPVLPPVHHPETAWTPVSNPGRTAPAPLMYQPLAGDATGWRAQPAGTAPAEEAQPYNGADTNP
ncbi:type II secretion system secretin GspD [Brachymonas denitrificans]|uniref:General secretion pathway protein D n=1 Tax=Brachymonas denitrificans DSM 15123 TaxID=1121117 RepID=A0A1H8IXV3_9BURK|nr:type II secretion system secretin GspD [Brachymonas denitrificans]SEN73291.1 general secretion pathway protein D [Brachymonas denitrificans DSM 15123]